MENPFYPTFWSPARPRRPAAAMAKPSLPAKVVSVPVHFASSGEESHRQPTAAAGAPPASTATSAAALRIQSAFRGFLVRKNLGSVRRLEAEMDAIEREMDEGAERLRRDGRERIRVSEALMSVLLRLDSVRGVRECRRRAIRRAIALQEAVDAIAFAKEAEAPVEIQQAAGTSLETLGDGHRATSAGGDANGEGRVDEKHSSGDVFAEEVKHEDGSTVADAVEEALEDPYANPSSEEVSEEDRDMHVGSGAKEDEGSADAKGGESSVTVEVLPDPGLSVPLPNVVEGEGGQGCGVNMRQVMKTMAEENRGLKGLVAELLERNEMQCHLMSGLLQRVEHLEKVVERMGRKKKRRAANAKKTCVRKCDRRL